MDNLVKDIRYGIRALIKNPGFTAVALITLMLGIGANSAIFSVVDAVLLRPLPYDRPDQLVMWREKSPQFEDGMSISYPDYLDFHSQNQVFQKLAIFRRHSFIMTGTGRPEQFVGGQVSFEMFPALGINPYAGRVFSADDDKLGAPRTAILSYGLWQEQFKGNPDVVGRGVNLDQQSYTIIGVMPQGFEFPSRCRLWVPVGLDIDENLTNRGNHPGLLGIARLKNGISVQRALNDMDAIATRLEKDHPDSNAGIRTIERPLKDWLVGDIRPALLVLLGAVGFVLLIACGNVANLLLARAASRDKEFAVKAALGAGRGRIVRQLITESVLLAAAGGILALIVAKWGVKLIIAANPGAIPRSKEIGLDWRVAVFTAAISIATGLIFGLVPALQASKPDLNETLKEASRGSSYGRKGQRMRKALVVAEVSLAFILMIGAGLMIRSFYQLTKVDPGFNTANMLTFSVSLPEQKYSSRESILNFFRQAVEKMKSIPGVETAGASTGLPLGNNGNETSFHVVGQPEPPPDRTPSVENMNVTPDYFKAMGMSLLKGRTFNDQDVRSSRKVMIVDESFVKQYFPSEDPIGKQIRTGDDTPENAHIIVGVVRRVKIDGVQEDFGRVQSYFPYQQRTWNSMLMVLRTHVDPASLVETAREQIQSIDPDEPIYEVRTGEKLWDEAVAPQRMNLLLLGIFAGIALVLAAVGIYGVMAYSVGQRTHEIGIRMALGASSGNVTGLIVRNGMTLAVTGLGIGFAGSWALTRFMSSLLFNVNATDAFTFTLIPMALAIVAFVANVVPALRAARMDPMRALHYE